GDPPGGRAADGSTDGQTPGLFPCAGALRQSPGRYPQWLPAVDTGRGLGQHPGGQRKPADGNRTLCTLATQGHRADRRQV
ncbi:hypothetical protein, partial [Endozoicomonas sp. SESOKO3]|uniref:hypothetical protein n=1 Tax=Endozoicomonas sp. SESOKO3 TaxID=2828744 RepID=UPI0021484E48